MTLDLDGFVARIAAAFPDLAFSRAVLIDRGADHAVVVLDDAWVFRFPRSAAYAATFPIELKLLRALRSRTPLAIPDYLRVAPRQAFGGYPLIVGRELTAPMFASLSRAAQETLLADLAAFMTALHDLPVDCVTGDDTVVKTDAGWAAEGAQS